jgi:hypothetical protein
MRISDCGMRIESRPARRELLDRSQESKDRIFTMIHTCTMIHAKVPDGATDFPNPHSAFRIPQSI